MANSDSKVVYKVIFEHQEKIYELYANNLTEGALMGFIELEGLIFVENNSALVVDPGEEKVRTEFKGVTRTYVPAHAVLRIDEVKKSGILKSIKSAGSDKVTPFPGPDTRGAG